MSDQTDDGERKPAGGKTLSLKRTVDSGHVRQNISHGRSKSVVVETKRKRAIKPTGKATPAADEKKVATPTPTPKAAVKKPAAPKPAAPKAAEPAPAPKKDRSGMVLRTLTEEEKKARGRALDMARVREEEDRKRAEIEAVRRAEEEKVRAKEQAEAAKREAEEAKRLKAEEEAKKQAEVEAQKRLDATPPPPPGEETKPAAKTAPKAAKSDDKKPRGRPGDARPTPTPTRRNEPRRRAGKLTIDSALRGSDGDRQKSLAAMRRRAEREKKKAMGQAGPAAKVVREVVIPEAITVQELANRMAERAVDVIQILMKQGEMVTINDVIDSDSAQLIAEELGHTVKRVCLRPMLKKVWSPTMTRMKQKNRVHLSSPSWATWTMVRRHCWTLFARQTWLPVKLAVLPSILVPTM